MHYEAAGIPVIVVAGKMHGSGSSRDWAAKGPMLLGVRAALAESFEHIHRSNLIGMGILPLQFREGENAASLGLDGTELFTIERCGKTAKVTAAKPDGSTCSFDVIVRIDTPTEDDYYAHGGILQYVLRSLL